MNGKAAMRAAARRAVAWALPRAAPGALPRAAAGAVAAVAACLALSTAAAAQERPQPRPADEAADVAAGEAADVAAGGTLTLAARPPAQSEAGTPDRPVVQVPAPAPSAAAGVSAAEGPARGPVTNLPLPRFVSLKTAEGNVRRGPSLRHRIDWVYTRRSMPLEVTAEFGHWRQVRDRDGAGGWVHYALLSGVRTVLVERDMVALRQRPQADARVLARAEAGVVARLGRCGPQWCRITAGRERGWVPKSALWGVRPDEIRD